MTPHPLTRVRTLCLSLPEAHEALSHGEPTFRVKGKQFAMYASADNHHGNGRPALWVKATIENQQYMIRDAPDRYFKPPYVGPSGWIGVWLDGTPDWEVLHMLLTDAYRRTAPKKLAALVLS